MLGPRDMPYGELVPPCMESFFYPRKGCSTWHVQINCQSSMKLQLDHSSIDCWPLGLWLWYLHIGWVASQGNCGTSLWGTQCNLFKFLEISFLGGIDELILEGPYPLSPHCIKLVGLCRAVVVADPGGCHWRYLGTWDILQGREGPPNPWWRG